MAMELWKGNEAIAEAAVRAGCRYFFGYPITPQNEIPEYMSMRLPQVGGCFLQSESELAAINMVYGAAGAGARVMTSSSSPGISLKQEGITYMVGAQLPAVIVNVMRGGPGLGTIQPAQGDYFQATRGGGNGDYRTIVLAPNTIQEAVDLTQLAFDLADTYRNPVIVLADGMIGQMMEPIEWHDYTPTYTGAKDWAATGTGGKREHNIINSLFIDPAACEKLNKHLAEKYEKITAAEVRFEQLGDKDPEILLVAYGTPSRIAMSAVELLREQGIRAGLFRPITLWPFPTAPLREALRRPGVKAVLTVEMSMGQMVEDVRLAALGDKPVSFCGRSGGMIPTQHEIVAAAKAAIGR